jgi:hypothetical protein
MPKTIRLSPDLTLPLSAVTEVFGILARRDSGKTYTELKMAEQFVGAGLQVVSIDSMGVFWGLRASADGRGPGLPITIMGGSHADVPLVPTAGKVVAEVLAREPISAILDISDFRKNEQRRFVCDFLDEFYHLKKQHPTPVHLFLDEADLWAPQTPDKGWEVLLGAMQDIVRRGRGRGIGCTMATQRSAVLNKSVLSQISVLVAMQMTAPQDIDTVDYWIKHSASKSGREEILAALSQLQKGEAYFWSPAWLKIFRKVKVGLRETFDSSRTPEVGEKLREPKHLATVDIEKLKSAIEATVGQAQLSNPKLLKDSLASLKLLCRGWEMRAKAAEAKLEEATKRPAPLARTIPEKPAVSPADLHKLEQSISRLCSFSDKVEEIGRQANALFRSLQYTSLKPKAAPSAPAPRPTPVAAAPKPAVSPSSEDGIRLRSGERAILQALWCLGGSATTAKIGTLSGFPAGGSTFKTYLNVLRRHGMVNVISDLVDILPPGEAAVPDKSAAPAGREEILGLWRARLRAGERRVLDVLLERNGVPAHHGEVMEDSGIQSDSTFKTYINVLMRNGLTTKSRDERGELVAASKEILES